MVIMYAHCFLSAESVRPAGPKIAFMFSVCVCVCTCVCVCVCVRPQISRALNYVIRGSY